MMISVPSRPHLDLSQIRAVMAVRDEGTVTRAAERLGLSQPAVSRLVAMLEAELGFAVFDRTRKRLVPSERGRQFLDEAQAALRSLARLSVLAGELRKGKRGLLRVGTIPSLAYGLITRAVALHARSAPDIAIEIEQQPRERLIMELQAGRIDIGLCALPVAGARLRVETVLEATALCFLRTDHRLAHADAVTPSDLCSEPLILGVEAAVLRQRLDDAFQQAGASQHVVATTDSTPLIAALVQEGTGIAVSHALPWHALPRDVTTRPFRPAIPFTYVIVTQANENQPIATRSFCSALHDAAADWAGERRPESAVPP